MKINKKDCLTILLIMMLLILPACQRIAEGYEPWQVPHEELPSDDNFDEVSNSGLVFEEDVPLLTPTPNLPKVLPTLRSEAVSYTVKPGDSLAKIALAHQVSVGQILANNEIENPNLIEVGQVFKIPPSSANELASGFKIIPDSELVFSPAAKDFDIEAFIMRSQGFLARYTQEIDEEEYSGIEIVKRVAFDYSVNPRILLALLEYQNGWLTKVKQDTLAVDYPMNLKDPNRKGLYKQLAWTANELNRGYSLWEGNQVVVWVLADGSVMRIDATINSGTAGVQYLLGLVFGRDDWKQAITNDGFHQTYTQLFGNPFQYAYDPLIPGSIEQPKMQLPFQTGDAWFYTSGPHGGWGDGSAWAALDFSPMSDDYGCFESKMPVVASADGMVVRSENGAVVQDLDDDGFEQTGWTILYMHIATEDRAQVGDYLKAGDFIGYPSCEGGFSTGTHVHIARRYNGVWLSAFGETPFIMDNWIPASAGIEYDGYLSNNEQTLEAWNGRTDFNQIGR